MSTQRESTFWAYFDKNQHKAKKGYELTWGVIDSSAEHDKYDRLRRIAGIAWKKIPAPRVVVGERVLVREGLGYSRHIVHYLEPIFHKSTFNRFLYHIENGKTLMASEFHLTHREALVHIAKTRIRNTYQRLLGQDQSHI